MSYSITFKILHILQNCFFFHYDKTFTHEKDEYFMTYLIALIWLRETEDVGEDMDEMKREAETQTRMPEVTKDANI